MATDLFAPSCHRRRHRAIASVLLPLALAALLVPAPARAAAPPTAKTLYDKAVALDHEVRAGMASDPNGQQPGPRAFRRAIDAYRAVVWQHPASGYCDNALWQASQLAVEAFDRFGQERDRLAAISYLKMLVNEYPSSGFGRRARASMQRIERLLPADAPRPTDAAASAPPKAPEPPPVPVTRVERTAAPDATTVVVYLGGPVVFREERLSDPSRVFFDLAGTRPADAVKDAILTFESGLVRQIRVGRHPNSTTRVVVDTEGVTRHRAELLSEPDRLVITCWPEATTPSVPTAPAAARNTVPSATPVPVVSAPAPLMAAAPMPVFIDAAAPARPPSPGVVGPAPTAAPLTAAPIDTSGAPPAAPSSNVQGGYSLARQLGLGASRIVIDAGHGGHDPGAMVGTKTEAAITLDIALRLEQLLAQQPGLDVVLTRRADVFVPLQERTQIANREGADLFISIHVNASRDARVRGVETYLLDFASNADAESVAARENASSMMTMSSLSDLVKRIALTTKADESRDLAVHVQNTLVRRLRPHNQQLKDLGVKRAPFIVLIGASMPSVLVEVAFLTHRQEGRLLNTQTYRQRIAESLADGVRRYQQGLKKASPVVLRRDPAPATLTVGLAGRDQIQ